MTQSEFVEAPVPAAADSFTSMGIFTVPANVKRLKKIRIGIAIDGIALDVSFRWAPVLRLLGSGILEQSPHVYVGPTGGFTADTTGYASGSNILVDYDVDIPVTTGGTIDAQLNTFDEVIAAGDCMVNLFYDEQDAQADNNMSDTVDAAQPAAADAFATIGTFTVPRSGGGKDPKKITRVVVGIGVDQGAVDFAVRLGLVIRLSGSGIGEGGTHTIVGVAGDSGGVTPGAQIMANLTNIIEDEIPVNAGGQILAEMQFVGELQTASTVIVGVMYE